MKTSIVRLSVLALATTGFAAATVTSKINAKLGIYAPVVSSCPVPSCGPHDPNHCGMEGD